MTDRDAKSEPYASESSADCRSGDNSGPKGGLPNEDGPGSVGVELSGINGLIRDLDRDKAIAREARDLLRLYFTQKREKLQLKLRLFGEIEKIKTIESMYPKDDGAQKTERQRSLAEALVKARFELQKASTAVEQLCRDEAKWEIQEVSARKWRQSREWGAITPEELRPAVDAIRHKINHKGFWQAEQSTKRLCFAALHPGLITNSGRDGAEGLAPYTRFLVGLLGRRIEERLLRPDRPAPMIFNSYLDVLETAMKAIIRGSFQEMFEIARVRNDLLGLHPVEWTRRQFEILVSGEKSAIRLWIKQVCDPLGSAIGASLDDSLFWGSWRAPRLIHMQPAGNARYDQANVWAREDLVRSEELIEGRAERTTVFVGLELAELARAAHVEFAKRPVSQMKDMSPKAPLVSQSSPATQIPVGLQTTASPNTDQRVLPRSIPAPRYSGAIDWKGVEIVFLSDHGIQIRVNGKLTAPQNYAELGFADGRSKNPNKAWGALRSLAEHRGVLEDGSQFGEPWPKIEKRIQEIRKVLRELFGISADPLPFVRGVGYQAVFKICCGPSF